MSGPGADATARLAAAFIGRGPVRLPRPRAAGALLAAFLLACDGGGGGGPSGPAPPDPITRAGDYTFQIPVAGRQRTYDLHVPAGFDPQGGALPLVVAFHPVPGDEETMRRITALDAEADAEGFVVAYPRGFGFEWEQNCPFCTTPDRQGVDDIRFVRELLDHIALQLPIDRDRIYATGLSQGALFVHRLACRMADRLAAAASVGATMLEHVLDACDPARRLPILFAHGTEDMEFPVEGREEDLATSVPLAETVAFWVAENGCSPNPVVTELPDIADDGTTVVREAYPGCPGNADVVLYRVIGGGHTWPGSPAAFSEELGRKSLDLGATAVIVEFFLAHAR